MNNKYLTLCAAIQDLERLKSMVPAADFVSYGYAAQLSMYRSQLETA